MKGFEMNSHSLIVGGTSGLGLEIARNMAANKENPIIVGRHDPQVEFAEFRQFDLNAPELHEKIGQFVMDLPPISTLVYAAGFYQEGHITDISDEDIYKMVNVGGLGLMFFTKKLLQKQDKLDELVTVTSTSEWVPREYESPYNFVKAGAAHYSRGQSLDQRIGKTLIVGPSGMDTEFWDGIDKDTSKMMKPDWVADKIMELRIHDARLRRARILGATDKLPKRVEIIEPVISRQISEWFPGDGTLASDILHLLNEQPNLCSSDIAAKLGVDQTQVSRVGRKLNNHGYVSRTKVGRKLIWNVR